MVHNGIEYGMMQAFAEGTEILMASELGIDVVAAMGAWREGSVVRSWLLDLLVAGLEQNPDLSGIAPVARDSGEGRWTVDEAVRLGVSAPVISGALWTRFASQRESVAMKVVALLRNQFGGHAVEAERQELERVAEGDRAAGNGGDS
jgi:6-phosphogluconate dehydrogenase